MDRRVNRNTWVIVAAVVALLVVVGYTAGWFSAEVEAPAPAATAPAPAPGAGGTAQ